MPKRLVLFFLVASSLGWGEVDGYKELRKLAPFKDVSIIQRRFLPKAGRFEVFPNFGTILNDAFFFSSFASLRAGYFLSDQFNIELTGKFLSTNRRAVTQKLISEREVETRSFVFPKTYYGADIKWSPLYGKLSVFNTSILPFDSYFSLGYGLTDTNIKKGVATYHGGLGQVFALTKWMAFRWDFSLYFFQMKIDLGDSVSDNSFVNMDAAIGLSFFFPGVDYR